MAAVDILYIDITRRWNSMTLDQRESGTWGLASGMPWGVQAETCGSLSVPSCSGLR